MVLLKDIYSASNRLQKYINNTPLEYCERLSKKYDANIFLKREDLQKTRSFKIRGSINKILNSIDSINSINNNLNENHFNKSNINIYTASAGNHAQGVALGSKLLGIKSNIFCPITTPPQKLKRIEQFGEEYLNLSLYGDNFNSSLDFALENCKRENGIFIHPYDDYDVICGQGTITKEIIEEFYDYVDYSNNLNLCKDDNIDYIITCVGGGGLISGISSFIKNSEDKNINKIKIFGVEPEGADSMKKSLECGERIKLNNIDTFVDGASVSQVGEKTLKSVLKKIILKIF